MQAINTIVGRSDHHLSSAINSIPDVQLHLIQHNDDEYSLVPENDNRKNRNSRRKSNLNIGFDRQVSVRHRRIDLFQAARYGNLEDIKLLHQRHQIDTKEFFNQLDPETKLTALHYAARFNHYHICQYLVEECEADVNKSGDDGMKPLHYIARFRVDKDGQVEIYERIVEYLIEHGADINSRDDYYSTPLHHACERNNTLCASILLSRRANIEAFDRQKMHPLHGASFHGSIDTARLLIQHDADILAFDDSESIPFAYACRNSHYQILKMFFTEFKTHPKINEIITAVDIEQNTLLHLAVASANIQIVELLLEKNADPTAKREDEQSPIHICAKNDSVEILKKLIDAGGNLNDIDSENETILHKVAAHNNEHLLEYILLKQNNNKDFIRMKNNTGVTALLLAATFGHTNCIILLLKAGANMFDDRDKRERSAIYLACMGNHLQALKILLDHARKIGGIEKEKLTINEIDRYSRTSLHAAAQLGHVEITQELLERQALITMKDDDEYTPLMLCCKNNNLNVLKVFIEYINEHYLTITDRLTVYEERDDGSNTALHIAASEGHAAIVTLLLEQQCDPEARNMISWLPIHCAAEHGRYVSVQTLLEHHSPVDPIDKNRQTPLHLAARNGHSEIVKLLLQNGAQIDRRTLNGDNCLDLAIHYNRYNVAETLIHSHNWSDVLRNAKYDAENKRWDTPFRKLIRKMPDIALIVLNRCCTIIIKGKNEHEHRQKKQQTVHENIHELEEQLKNNQHSETVGLLKDETQLEKLTLVYNYEFLDDQFLHREWQTETTENIFEPDGRLYPRMNDQSIDRKMLQLNHPFTLMVEKNREELLEHPLVHSLLEYKWNLFANYVYYFNFLFYLLFVSSLTIYVFLTFPPYSFEITLIQMQELSCEELCLFIQRNRTEELRTYQTRIHAINIFEWFVIILAILQIIKECSQMISQRLDYLNIENIVELSAFILSILFTIDFNACSRNIGYRCLYQWQLGAVAILLSWFALVLFMKKFPRFGIFVVMFTDILRTFSRFFLIFFLFIIGFAISFHMLLQNHKPFQHFGNSLLKTSVMMIGEFEYEEIFHGDEGNYFGVTYLLFIAFVIIMSIIIMNLLVGLAVDDINSVMRVATVKRLEMRIILTLDVERQLPRRTFFRFIRRFQTISYEKSSWRKVFHRMTNIDIPTQFQRNFTRLENYGLVQTAGTSDSKNSMNTHAINLDKIDEDDDSQSISSTNNRRIRRFSTDWISNIHVQINTKYKEFNRHMIALKAQQEKINIILQQFQTSRPTSRRSSQLTFAPTT